LSKTILDHEAHDKLLGRCVDVRADKRAVSLFVGWESPVAALKITARKGEAGVVSLGRGTAVEVAVEALHESAGRHREALDAMARRMREAITNAQRDKAFELAERLRALPNVHHVVSLATAPDVRSADGDIEIVPLLEAAAGLKVRTALRAVGAAARVDVYDVGGGVSAASGGGGGRIGCCRHEEPVMLAQIQ
jgi:hypothetical protein